MVKSQRVILQFSMLVLVVPKNIGRASHHYFYSDFTSPSEMPVSCQTRPNVLRLDPIQGIPDILVKPGGLFFKGLKIDYPKLQRLIIMSPMKMTS